ncbi:hypothetical protein N8371_06395 [Vicingaceae bacterium]|nr:hypothetical protein [Vicingaceae bacterium]
MKQLIIALYTSLFFLYCGEFSGNEKKEIQTVLALDEGNAIEKNGVYLIPIINEVAEKPLKLKAEVQEGNVLTLQFDLKLEPGEQLHFTINNGSVSKAKESEIAVELLEGNNVIFVCLSNTIGVSSTYWIKNYFNGEGSGSFNESQTHLFQHLIANGEGIVVDYQIMNREEGNIAVLQLDSVGYILMPKTPYLLKSKQAVRLELLNSEGDFVDGPFNDTGVIRVGGEE